MRRGWNVLNEKRGCYRRNRMRRQVSFALLLLLLNSNISFGQFAVIDAGNLVQTSLTAINTAVEVINQAVQIVHEVEIIKNQLEQLSYDAANLTSTPLSLLAELQSALRTYQQLLQQAQGLGYQISSIGTAFDTLYPPIGRSGVSSRTLVQDAQRWLSQLRSGSRSGMQMQAILERLNQQESRVTRAVAASEAAPGNLAAVQVTNQLLGMMSEQQASMQQMVAASQRAHVSMLAAQAAEADAAQSMGQSWLQGFGTMAPVQGVGIPIFH